MNNRHESAHNLEPVRGETEPYSVGDRVHVIAGQYAGSLRNEKCVVREVNEETGKIKITVLSMGNQDLPADFDSKEVRRLTAQALEIEARDDEKLKIRTNEQSTGETVDADVSFRESLKRRNIQVGKVYISKSDSMFHPWPQVKISRIDYENQRLISEQIIFGRAMPYPYEIDEIGEEVVEDSGHDQSATDTETLDSER